MVGLRSRWGQCTVGPGMLTTLDLSKPYPTSSRAWGTVLLHRKSAMAGAERNGNVALTAQQLDSIKRLRESQDAFYAGWLAGVSGEPMDEGQAHREEYVNGHRAGRVEGRVS